MTRILFEKVLFGICIVITFGGCFSGKDTGPNKDTQLEIQEMLIMGMDQEKHGDLDAALQFYKRLEKHKDTKEYSSLNVGALLESRGWSAGKLEYSLTLKVLTVLQNEINSFFERENRLPSLPELSSRATDGWGNPIVLEERIAVKHKDTFDYMLKSAGPDGIFENGDDLMILNKVINQRKRNSIPSADSANKAKPVSDIQKFMDANLKNYGEQE